MTRPEARHTGRLDDPLPIPSVPFVDTIEVSAAGLDPDEPSPCLPTAAAVWYVIRPERAGRIVVDLAGSTPLDPVVRLYRRAAGPSGPLRFLACASPAWNAQLTLEVAVGEGDRVLAQVGTSRSHEGRLVVRAELRT